MDTLLTPAPVAQYDGVAHLKSLIAAYEESETADQDNSQLLTGLRLGVQAIETDRIARRLSMSTDLSPAEQRLQALCEAVVNAKAEATGVNNIGHWLHRQVEVTEQARDRAAGPALNGLLTRLREALALNAAAQAFTRYTAAYVAALTHNPNLNDEVFLTVKQAGGAVQYTRRQLATAIEQGTPAGLDLLTSMLAVAADLISKDKSLHPRPARGELS